MSSSASRPTVVLGLTCFGDHDAAACLVQDGHLVAAAEEERYTRLKFDRSFPEHAINHCLKTAGLTIHDVEEVGFFWRPWIGTPQKMLQLARTFWQAPKVIRRWGGLTRDLSRAHQIMRSRLGYQGPFHYLEHHLTHAASAFLVSPFEAAAIITVDGTGEWDTAMIGRGRGNRIEKVRTVHRPSSLGFVYSAITQYLGFRVNSDEYKVMGLAPYGRPVLADRFRRIVYPRPSGGFGVDVRYFQYHLGEPQLFSERFVQEFGPPRQQGEPVTERHQDIAASLQQVLEEVLLSMVEFAMRGEPDGALCMAGGVALNSVACGKIARSGLVRQLYLSPVSGDVGCSLGSAFYLHNVVHRQPRRFVLEHAYWGSRWTDAEIEAAIEGSGLPYRKLSDPSARGAQLIAEGKVIGWFQGASEIGQRALGDRSILADPRRAEMKDVVNSKIKFREGFRPFAPSVLVEKASEWFELAEPSPFMTEVYPVRECVRATIPAVTHVDGSGRVQTVRQDTNPRYWSLIASFERLTGVPVVLNTSFNVAGEPIVDAPADALQTLQISGLDAVILGDYLVGKPDDLL